MRIKMPASSEQKKSNTNNSSKSSNQETSSDNIVTSAAKDDQKQQENVVLDDIGLNDTKVDMQQFSIDEIRKTLLGQAKNIKLKQIKPISQKQVSYKFGVIGLGHAGSRLAETFYSLDYQAIALNTATQDLVHINIPEENKMFLDIGIQGAAKDLARGELAAESYKDQIFGLISSKLNDSDILVICSSAGGGSGAGSLNTVVDLCQLTNKPIIIMAVLPMISEDIKTKSNSIETLSKLTQFVAIGKAHSIILVDNAKIESLYSNVSQMQFYNIANKSIVEPLDVFNTFSMKPSSFKPLDSMEFGTLLLDGNGISTYGEIITSDFEEDIGLGRAIVAALQENLLTSGLDYTQAKRIGYIVIGHEIALSKISASSLTFAHTTIEEIFGTPETTYKGIYVDNSIKADTVKIYTFVSGLGAPAERITELQKEVNNMQDIIKNKAQERAKNLVIDTGKSLTMSNVDKIKQQMAMKLSGLGKLNSLKR